MYNSNDNGQRPIHSTHGGQPVGNVWQVVNRIIAIIGFAMLGVGAFVFGVGFAVTSNAATLSLLITGGVLGFVGIVLVVVASSLGALGRKEQDNLYRLKAEGHGFDAEIIQIHRSLAVHLGRNVSAQADCSYTNKEGNSCLVRSNLFLHDTRNSYSARVYVSAYDPSDYAVEVFIQPASAHEFHDYR